MAKAYVLVRNDNTGIVHLWEGRLDISKNSSPGNNTVVFYDQKLEKNKTITFNEFYKESVSFDPLLDSLCNTELDNFTVLGFFAKSYEESLILFEKRVRTQLAEVGIPLCAKCVGSMYAEGD